MTAGFDRGRRTLVPELMDTEAAGQADLAACLDDLAGLSRWTGGYSPTLHWLGRVTAGLDPGVVPTVLDLGCGDGAMLRRIWRWSRRRGLPLWLRGVDINPAMVALARSRTPAEAPIAYAVGDALALPRSELPDFIISALFLHHLDDTQAVRLLRACQARARRGWLVNDLHRHEVPYWFLRALGAVVPMHRFVRHDGPVSVARAWTGAELRHLAEEAGVNAGLRWHVPFRWTLESASP